MSKYKNSKIYKLVSPHTDEIYIGSTVQRLCHRLSGHKRDCREGKVITNKKLFELGGVKIILIEDFPCDRKEELIKRERHYIENFDCVNKVIPGRTPKEYYQDHKEHLSKKSKIRYENNKEKIAEKTKEYREENKEKIAEKKKEYCEKNKEKVAQRKKEYYQANKEIIDKKNKINYEKNKEKYLKQQKEYGQKNKEKIAQRKKEYYHENQEKIKKRGGEKKICECGSSYTHNHFSRHIKTIKHQSYLSNK